MPRPYQYHGLQDMLITSLDARHTPQGMLGNDVTGVGHATSGSITDQLTRQHRMTLDEARLILNVKRGDSIDIILKVKSVISCHQNRNR